MFFLSNTAYSYAPDGVLTDWSDVTELLNRKKEEKKQMERNGLIVYLSYCFYRTNVNDFLFFLVCICLFVVVFFFCWLFSVETWSSLPRVHTLHVQQHHSDSQMLLFKSLCSCFKTFSYQNKG